MRKIRTGLVMALLVGAGVVGMSAPANACSLNGRNCYFPVICAQQYLPGDPVGYAECLQG